MTTRVCLMTCPNLEVAQHLARQLLQQRLVACVNVIPQITSLYWWQGEIQEDSEVLLLAKTEAQLLEALLETVPKLHPYQVPEILVLPIESGLPSYLSWIEESLKKPGFKKLGFKKPDALD